MIKAKAWMCPVCGALRLRHFKQHRSPTASWCISEAGPLYGPDDLVRAVLAGIAHGAGEGLAFVETNPGDIAEANVIVDRLTKGDV